LSFFDVAKVARFFEFANYLKKKIQKKWLTMRFSFTK